MPLLVSHQQLFYAPTSPKNGAIVQPVALPKKNPVNPKILKILIQTFFNNPKILKIQVQTFFNNPKILKILIQTISYTATSDYPSPQKNPVNPKIPLIQVQTFFNNPKIPKILIQTIS